MISETTFATSYASLWRILAPNSELVIKQLNQSVQTIEWRRRVWSSADRRAFINEVAFWVFIEWQRNESARQHPNRESVLQAGVAYARRRQEQFRGRGGSPATDLTMLEQLEVGSLVRLLGAFKQRVTRPRSVTHLIPRFRGCGILNECEADLIVGDTLIEIKAGDRNFRSIDIRQMLIYCALDALEGKFGITRVACVNPRRGTYFLADLETLCLQLASKPASELLAEIAYFLSSGDMSR